MKILSMLGGSQNWTSFWGHFYAIFGPFLSSMYRKKNLMGIVWGLLKFQFYLSIYFSIENAASLIC